MRRQTRTIKKRNERDDKRAKQRTAAVRLIELQTLSLRQISDCSGIPLSTLSRIKRAVEQKNVEAVHAFLNPHEHRAGAAPRLDAITENIIEGQLKKCALRGFAVDSDGLMDIAADVAAKRGTPFKNGRPSLSWVRAFRSRHRELTHRSHERKEAAKLDAEDVTHVKTLKTMLETVFRGHPDIKDDPSRVWNLDETQVSGEYGEKVKVFGPASSCHGGFRSSKGRGTGKHLTALVIASAAGEVLPPFFVFEGKNSMTRWFEPLSPEIFKDGTGVPYWFTKEDWFPKSSFCVGTKKGSMDVDVIPFVVDHINAHAKRRPGESLLLLLDGHKSRGGIRWIEKCMETNIEVVQLPANTTHFLQPCDDKINKTFQVAVRATRDIIRARTDLDFGDMNRKLILGTAGYAALTPFVVRQSFARVGLWPMDYRFMDMAIARSDAKCQVPGSAPVYRQRLSTRVVKSIRDAIQSGQSSEILQEIIDRKISQAVNTVGVDVVTLVDARSGISTQERESMEKKSRDTLQCGQPAAYLTHENLLEKRRVAAKARNVQELLKKEKEAIRQKEKEDRERRSAEKKRLAHEKRTKKAHERNAARRVETCNDEPIDVDCANMLLMLGASTRASFGTFDESAGDQACLDDPDYDPVYRKQHNVDL